MKRVPHFSRFSRSGAFPADNFRVVQSKSPTVVSSVIRVAAITPTISATASGSHAVSQIQVWVNSKKVLQVNGATLTTNAWLPVGKNERLGILAIDARGV